MKRVAVVGAGAAGLRAAITAARAHAAVVLVDGYHRAGGQYFRQPVKHVPSTIQRQGSRLIAEARAAGVEFRLGASVWGVSPHRLHLSIKDTVDTVDYDALVVATGAYERVVPFPGWTLPGVYPAGAVQSLLKEHDLVPGQRVLLAGTGPLLLVVGAELAHRGVTVAGVLEATRLAHTAARHPWLTATGLWRQGERIREGLAAAARLRQTLRTGWGIVRAFGGPAVEGAVVARLDAQWNPVPGTEKRVACDTIATHYSLVPAVDLLALVGAELEYAPGKGGWVPVLTERLETTVPGVFAAGDCTGIGGAGMSLAEGDIAGGAATGNALRRERRFQRLYGTLFTARPDLTIPDTIVCRCEDVPRSAIDAAVAAGARTAAMVKSVTRCGMGPCQGRICRPIVEQLIGVPPTEPPTARPPLVPMSFEAMRG